MKKLSINNLKFLIKEIIVEETKKINASAGILLWHYIDEEESDIEVLLALPGGPYYVDADVGYWGIPKGRLEPGEEPMAAAFREFAEETGSMPKGKPIRLPNAKLNSGKIVYAWAVKGNLDSENFVSNDFELEWPKGSGKIKSFPEIAQVAWFDIKEAKAKMTHAQQIFIDALVKLNEKDVD